MEGGSLEYWYLTTTGAYMKRKWISPFDLYGALMWGNKQQARSGNPEESDKIDIRLGRESVGNGAGNPLLITTET